MLRNYLKIAWRNLTKNKFYSALNIFGLSLGIACTLFLYLFISYHLSFDSYHKKASTTFRVVNEVLFEQTLYDKGASLGMYKDLMSGVLRTKSAAVMLQNYTFTLTADNDSEGKRHFKEDEAVSFVSPEWFNTFDYKLLAGNLDELKAPNTTVLSENRALKYFGDKDPLGKTLVFDNKQPVKVVAVISDKPANTDLKAGIYVSLASIKTLRPDIGDNFFTDWANINSGTSLYITLPEAGMKQEVEAGIAAMSKSRLGDNSKYYRFRLQPLADVHFNNRYGGFIQKSLLTTLGIIASLILIIASVNYINLSIARQAKRGIEIGTRKVLGGTPRNIFTQFIVEASLTTFLALCFAACLVVFLLPAANRYIFQAEPVYIVSYRTLLLFSSFLFIALVVLSGFYPSFILSKLSVFKALQNEPQGWHAGILRRVLVIGQNSVAQVLILCTVIIVLQVRYLKSTDKGFDRESVVMIALPDTSKLKQNLLAEKLKANPRVESYSFCFKAPSIENFRGGSVRFANREWESWPARSALGDTGYVKAFGLKLVSGRNFRAGTVIPEFLVNETMIKKLGLKVPEEVLGKSLIVGELTDRKGIIVGVVKDFNTMSLNVPIEPVLIAEHPAMFSSMGVKLKAGNYAGTLENIRISFEEVYPKEIFDFNFLDDQIAGLYRKEEFQQKIVWLSSFVAIVISCLGLLGLVSLITLQRTKEIGIRKVLGASVSGIISLITADFLKLIFTAVLIATPIAWYLMNRWLESFAYRIEVKAWMFALSAGSAMLIAIVTISYQAVKAALANPVKSLRSE